MTFKNRVYGLMVLAGMTLANAMLDGCAHKDPFACHRCPIVYYPGGPNCFGYYPTCWRAWPDECVPCPSFAQQSWEDIPNTFERQPIRKLPPLPVEVAPIPPATELAPQTPAE